MRVVVLVQARSNSQRFPAKVLAPFCGMPMLAYQARRFQKAGWRVGVLCPRGDDGLLAMRQDGLRVHQIYGDEQDVLGRYARYARTMLRERTVIVRGCSDSPLLCPYLLRDIIAYWQVTSDLAYLGMGPGWPDGLGDFDVFTREALLQADADTTLASDREHVGPAFWKYPEQYTQILFPPPNWVRDRQWPKLSVDTPEDLAYVEDVARITTAAYGEAFTWEQVLNAVGAHTNLQQHYEPMNAAYVAQVARERGEQATEWEGLRYGR